MDLPWQAMGVGLALSLVFSALGFKRPVYFVSLGYAGSIAAQAIAIPLLYRETIEGWALAQSALERKESRLGLYHNRTDFPEKDDVNFKKFVILKRAGDSIDVSFRPVDKVV